MQFSSMLNPTTKIFENIKNIFKMWKNEKQGKFSSLVILYF